MRALLRTVVTGLIPVTLAAVTLTWQGCGEAPKNAPPPAVGGSTQAYDDRGGLLVAPRDRKSVV